MDLELHGYWRSSPSWRVRIALQWKGLPYRVAPVNILKGEQLEGPHLKLNPHGRVPVLVVDGEPLTQGPAILEWLEEVAPSPPLLPADVLGRARVRAMAALVACDITPLQNLIVGRELRAHFDASGEAIGAFTRGFIARGLAALDAMAAEHGGGFCYGDAPSLADLYLVTQLFGARRFGVDLASLGRLVEIEARCAELPAFQAAAPERQPDAQPA
jgi:maleylpyruvate isomerase